MNVTKKPAEVLELIKQGKILEAHKYNITQNFTWGEVLGNCHKYNVSEITISMLLNATLIAVVMEGFRRKYNSRIHVTSWVRPKTYNAAVGGRPSSIHLRGGAVDFYFLDCDNVKAFEDILKTHNGGVASKKVNGKIQFIHVDNDVKRTWSY